MPGNCFRCNCNKEDGICEEKYEAHGYRPRTPKKAVTLTNGRGSSIGHLLHKSIGFDIVVFVGEHDELSNEFYQ